MLDDLVVFAGNQMRAGDLLGVPGQCVDNWRGGGATPSMTARRGIWATWARFLHPELMQTSWDWMTWGRFYRPPEPAAEGDDWDDWSI